MLWFEQPVWSALLALVAYALVAMHHGALLGSSSFPFYNYLADAFLHGQLALRLLPPNTMTWCITAGNTTCTGRPMPALLLVPFVALFGVGFSDILFTIVLAGAECGPGGLVLRAAPARDHRSEPGAARPAGDVLRPWHGAPHPGSVREGMVHGADHWLLLRGAGVPGSDLACAGCRPSL